MAVAGAVGGGGAGVEEEEAGAVTVGDGAALTGVLPPGSVFTWARGRERGREEEEEDEDEEEEEEEEEGSSLSRDSMSFHSLTVCPLSQ